MFALYSATIVSAVMIVLSTTTFETLSGFAVLLISVANLLYIYEKTELFSHFVGLHYAQGLFPNIMKKAYRKDANNEDFADIIDGVKEVADSLNVKLKEKNGVPLDIEPEDELD
jgi:hypothetical protein